MGRKLLFVLLSLFVCVAGSAMSFGGMAILVEESQYANERYYYCENREKLFNFIEKEWNQGRRIVSVTHAQFGWLIITATNTGYTRQGCAASYTTNGLKKKIMDHAKDNLYVSSMAYGDLNIIGLWFTFFSSMPGVTSQTQKCLKLNQISKWTQKSSASGYRITSLQCGKNLKWMATMCSGTGIDRQTVAVYDDISALKRDWAKKKSEGYSIQLANCDTNGNCVVVYCTYKDGRTPRQYFDICYNYKEVEKFIKSYAGGNRMITHVGGGYYYAPDIDWGEIIGGAIDIAGNVANIAVGAHGGGGSGSGGGGSTTTSGGSSSGGGSSVSGKCKSCQGSGTCSAVRQSCHGSGKCHYCNGDGFNYTAGNPVKCNGCNGTGKCKYCGGSGKCPKCKGSGKA